MVRYHCRSCQSEGEGAPERFSLTGGRRAVEGGWPRSRSRKAQSSRHSGRNKPTIEFGDFLQQPFEPGEQTHGSSRTRNI